MILHAYKNGQTVVTIHSDGTKTRDISEGTMADSPESIDVKVTNWCNAGCAFCHEKSTTRGQHADLQPTIDLLLQLPQGAEIAIGGGHPLAHPEFENFVREVSSHGIICNVTVNEVHFQSARPQLERLINDKAIYGVGYSYNSIPVDWDYEHLVSHVIVGVTPYKALADVTRVCNKVLLLGFKKETGRGSNFFQKNPSTVDENIRTWYAGLFHAARQAHLSFDNLAIKQLNPRRLFVSDDAYQEMFMGEDGLYSMYIDAVTQTHAKSSTSNLKLQYSQDIRDMFKLHRDS